MHNQDSTPIVIGSFAPLGEQHMASGLALEDLRDSRLEGNFEMDMGATELSESSLSALHRVTCEDGLQVVINSDQVGVLQLLEG
jgi:hypothetical protein